MRSRSRPRHPWSACGALALLLAAACTDGRSPTGPTLATPHLDVADFGACSPLRPIAWYPLDGDGTDASGNGNDGTIVGASPAANRHGAAVRALSFDGIDDAVGLGDRFNTLALPVSMAAWIRQPAAARSQYRSIFITDDPVGSYFGISLQLGPAGDLLASYGSGGLAGPMSRRTVGSVDPVPTDTWVHVAVTMRGPTDMTLYVNGVAVPGVYSGTTTLPLAHSSAPARIGVISSNPENRPWAGQLDDVRAYDCSLGADGVAALLNPPPRANAGDPYTGREGIAIVFDATGSSDPDGEPIASYAWDFGDGSTGTGPAPEHAYAVGGTYTVKLTVTDAAGASAEATTTAAISDVAPEATFVAPASADEGTSVTISLTSPSVTGARYALDCGDGSGFGPIGEASGRTCPFADDGEATVRGRVFDPTIDDLFTEYGAVVAVANVAPVVTAIRLPTDPVAIGTSIEVGATFTDVGSGDTHTGSFDLDDGAAPVNGSVVESDGSGTASAVVTYSQAGVHVVRAAVTDDDGASAERSSALDVPSYIVVYDPAEGFVTGGGWMWSPSGSHVSNPALEGRASFGFVAKYQKGASTPGGGTEFQFRAGSLSFRSTSYEWLVIAGARAKYKGEGTLDGADGYGFMVTAIDGDVNGGGDAFRIKIWELATGSVVYDNVRGEDDSSGAATSLGGGSIVIHH